MLVDRRASAPFGAVRANYPDGSGMPEVQITNPAGGILGGDVLGVDVDVAPGSSATVVTQAASKAYRREEASQTAVFRVGGGAFLEYLPHHLIPYASSNYRQETTFHLVPDAVLLTWDAFSAGRVARGERFAFDRLRARTSVFRRGVPEAVDGLDLAGWDEPFGGYSYTTAAYVVAPRDLGPLVEKFHDSLAGFPGALASASAPAPGLCAVRVLTAGAPGLYGALNGVRTLVRRSFGLAAPAARGDLGRRRRRALVGRGRVSDPPCGPSAPVPRMVPREERPQTTG